MGELLDIQIEEELYPWQAEFMGIGDGGIIIPTVHHNFAKCGTKAGKTAGTALGLFTRALNIPDTRWLWTAPVNKQLEPTWGRYFRPLIDSIPKSLVKVRDAYGMWSVEFKPTNAMIALKSGDEPWNLRGDAYHGAVIDEAAHYQLESYYSVLTNLTETAGILWAISTPKANLKRAGMTWFDAGFAEGMRQMRPGFQGEQTHRAFRVPTWSNPKPEIQKWVAMIRHMAENGTLPGGMMHFRREYGAEDVGSENAIFRHIDKLHTEEPCEPIEGHNYVMGFDPAGRGGDASVISVWDVTLLKEVHIEYMLQVPLENQFERLQFVWNKYFRPMGRVDATALTGDFIEMEFQRRGLTFAPVKFNQYTKAQYVQMLGMAMEKEEPRFLNDPIGRTEMEQFGYEVLPSGVVRYGAPTGMRDDTVTARMLAWAEIATGVVQVF